jgi:hypothetical protein
MITLLLIIPLIGALIIFPMSSSSEATNSSHSFSSRGTPPFGAKSSKVAGTSTTSTTSTASLQMKKIALTTSLINFFISLFL